jgi:hypothetical protein
MGKRDARLFQDEKNAGETLAHGWNIVELESHRQLRQTIHELMLLANSSSISTSEMQQRLLHGVVMFGKRFATQLVRSLQRDDQQERQTIVWLLTILNDQDTIQPLQQMVLNERLPRKVRLSASLALAGMGATREVADLNNGNRRVRLYAIS